MVSELLKTLGEQGVTVTANGDKVRVEPASKLPADLIPRIRESKPEILAALRKRPPACAASCYEVEPGKWIHHPWHRCTTIAQRG